VRVLTVYAHPDDESFGPASVLARWAREGAEIHGVWFTRGEHGAAIEHPPPDTAELARIRERNLREAAALIGYRSVNILDYEDGTLAGVHNLHLLVLGCIREHEPEVVMTFGPAGITRHSDHLAVHRATFSAFVRAQAAGIPVRELYYDAVPNEHAHKLGIADEPDGNPNTWIDVQSTQSIKVEALRIHARHIADARERLERLERQPLPVETLFRAYPPAA
jgi:LmbE family N-acetylglucosaminyl deacetylase